MGESGEHLTFRHEVPAEFVEYARKVVPPHPVVCDIGSRDALDGIFLSRRLQAAECHIFEPNPSALTICRANIVRYGGELLYFLNPVALADKVGAVDFFPVEPDKSGNADIGFSSMFPINPAYTSKRRGSLVQGKTVVHSTTLDSYFEGRDRQPDLLWVDAEGAELLIFSGATRALEHVKLIHVEVSFRPMHLGKPLFWEIDRFLRGRHFKLLEFMGVSRLKGFLVVHKLIPNLPWRWNAVYGR